RLVNGAGGRLLIGGDLVQVSGIGRSGRGATVAVGPSSPSMTAATAVQEGAMPVVARLDQLPFRERAFDTIATGNAFERLDNDAEGARELARVVRHGGRAVLSGVNRDDALLIRARVLRGLGGVHHPKDAFLHSNDHIREYSWRELERLLVPAFRILRRHPVGWNRGWKSAIASSLVRRAPARRFSSAMVLEAEPR
ncbi:MAG: methyltransferase domain-containing protein, partial [Actinobacteria bacterium]|nr:methyltransferase domain-containing protein [Actinomycetota bacterium]